MTTMKFEDQAAMAETTFNVQLDGGYAATELSQIITPEQAAHDFIYRPERYIGSGPFQGLYDVYQKPHGEARFAEMQATLSGRAVLAILPGAKPMLAPAGLQAEESGLRVTILQTPAVLAPSGETIDDQKILLAGAAQTNNPNIGRHGPFANKAEAGHLLNIMGGALQPAVEQTILQGKHVIDKAREQNANIVAQLTTPEAGASLLPTRISSRQFTYETWPAALRLLARRPVNGEIMRLDTPNAVPLLQGIGYGTLVKAGVVAHATDLAERMG